MHTVHKKTNYESDDALPESCRIGRDGIAYRVCGWETQPDADTEWTGIEERTGNVIVVMVGDDRKWSVDCDDIHPIDDLEYCHVCGQIGCTHDGIDRG